MEEDRMSRLIKHKPSPALVVATVALFVALGGTGYAVTALPRNSVGSPQVVNGSLQSVDLSTRAIRALKGNRGSQGQAGMTGPPGSTGPIGAQGATGVTGSSGPQGASGVAGPAALFAHMDADGSVGPQRGVVLGPATYRSGTGEYAVGFGRDITQCVPVVTVGGRYGGAGTALGTATTNYPSTNQIDVETRVAGTLTDQPFNLALIC